MGTIKILMLILFVMNAGQTFCAKINNSVSEGIMSGIEENDDNPILVNPSEVSFPGLIIQDFQPEELPTAVNEQTMLAVQIPTIEQQEQEVENVSESYLGSLEGTDTGLLVQAVQTGDMRPYVSFFKGETKHRINRFLDQAFPDGDQISFIASNGWSKGDFKALLNDAIDSAVVQVAAPTGYQLRDLDCTYSSVFVPVFESIEHFIDGLSGPIDENIVIERLVLRLYDIRDDIFSYCVLKRAFRNVICKVFSCARVVVSTTAVCPKVLAGTDTELLFQAVQTGDMLPYVDYYKEQLKSRINQFLDQLAPGDNQVNLINPEITNYLLSDRTKGAFKTAINERINAAAVRIDAPTGYEIEGLLEARRRAEFPLFCSIDDFFRSFTDDISMLDPSIIVDQNALCMVDMQDEVLYDIRSGDGLGHAFCKIVVDLFFR